MLTRDFPKATTHWAQFLSKMQFSLTISHSAVEGLTSNIVKKFYTPQDNPQKLIVPVSIVSGIAGAISGVNPPAAVAAGAGSVANGILTQAGLDKPEYVILDFLHCTLHAIPKTS